MTCTLGGINKIGIGPDWTGLDHGSDHRSDQRKQVLKEKNAKQSNCL